MKQLTQQQLEQVYREHPEWALEAGKWYNYSGWLLCFVRVESGLIRAYGIDLSDGEWSDEDYFGGIKKEWTPASDSEVAEALIAEARRRGFKAGVEINNSALGFYDSWQEIEGDDIEWKGGHLNFGERGTAIFYNGKWADVREVKTTVEVGKWYKLPDNVNFLFCVTELLSTKSAYGYGWCKQGKWHDVDNESWGCEDVVPATHEEICAALIGEAKKRGYVEGIEINIGDTSNEKDWKVPHGSEIHAYFSGEDYTVTMEGGGWSHKVFNGGKWAAIRKQVIKVEIGKWYKLEYNEKFLVCLTGVINPNFANAYGWDELGNWIEDEVLVKDVLEATHEEVESALIAEAKRRYRDGDKLNTVIDDCSLGKRIFSQNLYYQKSDWSLWVLNDGGTNYDSCIFSNGKWATVVTPASTLAEDIQALRDKYPDYNWTIVAEAK